jgi:2-oxoglutarate ferredoxin oxidoreductase subunit alpha
VDPAKMIAVLHFDGTPITARFIAEAISERISETGPARVTEAAE